MKEKRRAAEKSSETLCCAVLGRFDEGIWLASAYPRQFVQPTRTTSRGAVLEEWVITDKGAMTPTGIPLPNVQHRSVSAIKHVCFTVVYSYSDRVLFLC